MAKHPRAPFVKLLASLETRGVNDIVEQLGGFTGEDVVRHDFLTGQSKDSPKCPIFLYAPGVYDK
jgi:hypothetical protein